MFGKRKNPAEEPTSDPITMLDGGENPFAASVDAGHRIDPRAQKVFVMCVVLLVLYVISILSPHDMLNQALHNTRSAGYTESWFISDLQKNVSNLVAVLTGNADSAGSSYISSMIRNVVVALAGAGLALSGAVYQGAFRNALVSPSTLGVMTGAQFGMMVWVVLAYGGGSTTAWAWLTGSSADVVAESGIVAFVSSSLGAAVVSFAGCLMVVGLVLLTVRLSGGGTSAIVMIITGQMVSGVLGAVSSLVRYYYVETDPYGQVAQMLQNLQIASFWREFGVVDIVAIFVPLALTFIVVMRLSPKMMLLSFDEAEQRAMGVNTKRVQNAVVVLCTLLTAIIVSFCGSVGFVGFLVPHLARRLVGPNFKYLLPASTVLGAIFVLGAYYLLLATLGTDYETMVGMYISIAGALVFLVTALRGKGVSFGGFR